MCAIMWESEQMGHWNPQVYPYLLGVLEISLGTAVILPSKVCKGSGHSDIKTQNAGTPSLAGYMLTSFISYNIISSSQAGFHSLKSSFLWDVGNNPELALVKSHLSLPFLLVNKKLPLTLTCNSNQSMCFF